MEPSFWHQKWDLQQIGFHLEQVNPLLIKYWSSIPVQTPGAVFVPLCGKSLDMCYLAELGHDVIGCELNQAAVEQFFTDNQLPFNCQQNGEHKVFSTEQVSIFQGDIFTLSTENTAMMSCFYDRAALIAWPESMRQQYAQKLAELIPRGVSGLLVTLDYPQDELSGPPFAVSLDWINQYLANDFDVQLLESEDVLAGNARFVNKGVSWLNEAAYKLTRK